MSIVKIETSYIEPMLENLYGKKGTVEHNAYDAEVQNMFDTFEYEPCHESLRETMKEKISEMRELYK